MNKRYRLGEIEEAVSEMEEPDVFHADECLCGILGLYRRVDFHHIHTAYEKSGTGESVIKCCIADRVCY